MSRRLKAGIIAAVAMLLAAALAAWWIGGELYAPAPHRVGSPPDELGGVSVTFPSASGSVLSGWFFPGSEPLGVVLMHGSGGDRRSMMGRTRFLHDAGYPVLAFDFRGHGESPGTHVGDGYLESYDARGAVDFIRAEAGVEKVAVIGFSLGGAAALLGPFGPLPVDAMVLEAVYPTIEEATASRIRVRLGPHSGWLYRLFTWQLPLRLGIAPADLRPIDRIHEVDAPVLIVAGESDRRTTLEQSLRLFAAARPPKQLWVVSGARHEDFHRMVPRAYEQRVLRFLAELHGGRAPS